MFSDVFSKMIKKNSFQKHIILFKNSYKNLGFLAIIARLHCYLHMGSDTAVILFSQKSLPRFLFFFLNLEIGRTSAFTHPKVL